ncbi:MAG: DegV family protein, partial [Chloroflexota bacterium]
MIKIATDGSADMPKGWEEEYGIHLIPLSVVIGEEKYIQGRDIDSSNFYSLVREKRQPPKTSLPSPRQITEFYQSIARKGEEILSIHISSKLSGTYAAVKLAAEEIASELRVTPFDSGAGSAALGFMCREARMLNKEGWEIPRIIQHLESIRDRVTVIFTLENLEFAYLSGRINKLQTALSSLLRINPIIVLRDGLLSMSERMSTRQKALNRVIEKVQQRVGDSVASLAVVHAAAPEAAAEMVEKIKK